MANSLIIGGSHGIGLEVATQFQTRGDRTYVLSRGKRDWQGLHFAADLLDDTSLDSFLAKVAEQKIQFEYLVFAQKNRIAPNDMDLDFNFTIKSTAKIVEGLLPGMQNGSVVFIGSPASQFVVREQPLAYHITKAALEQMTRYYAVQHGRAGIRFNCVLPGTILKKSNIEFYKNNPETTDLLERITPLAKVGSASDIANTISYLCSQKSAIITGQILMLDGGICLEGQESLARDLMSMGHGSVNKK